MTNDESKDAKEKKAKRDRILNFVRVAVSLFGLAIIVLTQDLGQALRLLLEMNWPPFLGTLILFLSGSFIRAYRWGCLVWALGVQVGYWRLVSLYFIGSFFSQFLPTGVGGDAVKMFELSRQDGKAANAISSVLVDRFLGLFVLFGLALVALLFGRGLVPEQARILIAVVFIASLAGVALILQRTWIESLGKRLRVDRVLGRIKILRELYESLYLYSTAALLQATVASLVWNLLLVFGYYLLGLAVGIDLPLWYYFLLVPVISAAIMVPSLGGLGVREGATVLLFTQVGVSEPQALALALAYLVALWFIALVGGILYFVQGMRGTRD